MRRKKAWALMQRLATGGLRAVITDTWKSLEHIPACARQGITVLCLAQLVDPRRGAAYIRRDTHIVLR